MKKILILITSSAWGGAERYVVRLAEAASREFGVAVAAGSSRGQELFRALPAGVGRFEIPELKHSISPVSDLRATLRLSKLIDAEGFDLIHCNSSKAGLVGAIAARLSKRRPKVVYTAHGWAFLERRSMAFRLLLLWSERLASRLRDATIVLSKKEQRVAEEFGLSAPEKLKLIPHGIAPEEIPFIDREGSRKILGHLAMRPLEGFVFGTIANAYPPKALHLLVEAFSAIAPDLAGAELIILGDGPEMPKVRAAREASSAKGRIHLPGAVKDAARLLRGFDAFVLPSVKEGMPWVILEASLAGTPIIATRVGALPEMIENGETGTLIEPGSVQALGDAMRAVAKDDALREKLKNGAGGVAARFSAAAMVKATLGAYHQLLSA